MRTSVRFRVRIPDDPDERKLLQDRLHTAQRRAVTMANVCMRHMWQKDAAVLDEYLIEHGQVPKRAAEWPSPVKQNDLYRLASQVAPDHSASARSLIARAVYRKWSGIRFDALIRQNCSPPHYRDTMPIPLRKKELKFTPHADGATMRCNIEAGRGNALSLLLRAKDSYAANILENILSGRWAYGDAAIVRDRRRKGRWYVQLTYKRIVTRSDRTKVAAINRGIRCFLAAITDEDETWIEDGYDIVATLKQFQRRRQQYQWASKSSGRAGRGKKRILRPLKALMDKGENWRHTKCQTLARRLGQWFHDRGVGKVYIEDFTGIRDGEREGWPEQVEQLIQEWPYYKFETMLKSVLDELGIEYEKVGPHYISQRCSKCGTVSVDNINLKRWKMICVKCDARLHLDVNAASNVLQRGEKSGAAKGGTKPPRKPASRKGRTRTSRKVSGRRPEL